MKKLVITIIFCLIMAFTFGQFMWEEPGIWAGQEKMIHADEDYVKTVMIETTEGIVAVWVESQEGLAQIYGQKYSLQGEAIWDEPIQFTAASRFPCLQSGIADTEGNIILAYFFPRDQYNIQLLKLDINAEFVWEVNWDTGENPCREVRLINGISNDIYLCTTDTVNEDLLYHFDEDGNLTTGWEDGRYYGKIDPGSWKLEEDGSLVIMYYNDWEIKLQRINLEGEEAFPQGILVFSDFLPNNDGQVCLDITSNGDYLCYYSNFVKCISHAGETCWDIENEGQSYYLSSKIIAKEDFFYLLSDGPCVIYQYSYDPDDPAYLPSFTWSYIISGYGTRVAGAWVRNDDGIRVIFKSDVLGEEYMRNYKLLDFNSAGEMISPEIGWYSEEGNSLHLHPIFLKTESTDIFWYSINRDDLFQQQLNFVTINEAGEILTGAEPIIVQTGIERLLIPFEVYVSEDAISVLLKHTGYPLGIYNQYSVILQRFDRQGVPLDNPAGTMLFFAEAQLLDRQDNLALFVLNNGMEGSSVQLVDLATGNYLWEEGGHICDPGYSIGVMAGDIYEGGASYYWQRGTSYHVQRIENGEEVFPPGGAIIPFTETLCWGSWLRDNYVINNIANYSKQHVKYLSDTGEIEWSHNCGHYFYYGCKENFKLTDEGLLALFQVGIYPPEELRCELFNETGDYVYGDGVSIPFNFEDELYGLVVLDNGFAVYGHNAEAIEPITFRSFNMDGSVQQSEINLPETEGCELVNVQKIEEGMLIFMTQADGRYYTLKMGLYDLSGNLVEMPTTNPVICYQEYCRQEHIAAEVYDNDVYFCWESLINRYDSYQFYDGNDVLLQGWSVPVVQNDEETIHAIGSSLTLMPNPFNPQLQISWNWAEGKDEGSLAIYNVKGQKVWTATIMESQSSVVWDGKDIKGNKCSSGVYFIRLQRGNEEISRKALLLK
ncbi:MAG: T9SS type A sorting domain-containing protein [Candidatus Stygibacter australis]|nr:T9SS type A sorting domain-containing protein [Candidatus Stygibacter australis]MDP8323177.1 T9SS type A sorting domain-containing protein [Candidatus Stygibacter australis]